MQQYKTSKTSQSEKIVQKHILLWLDMNNFFHWRQNNIAVRGRKFVGLKGVPDIIAVYPPTGKFIAIECKKKKEKQTIDQEVFQLRLEAAGGIYILAYELEDVIKVFKNLMHKK